MRHVHSSERANDALHDMGPQHRCHRCGCWDDDGSRVWCRDDNDHAFLPADHWLVKSAERNGLWR